MKYLLFLGFMLLHRPACTAQEANDRASQREMDSIRKEWYRVDDSITVEWNKTVALIMKAPQFSEKEKKELTNYCTANQYRNEATKYWLTIPMIGTQDKMIRR